MFEANITKRKEKCILPFVTFSNVVTHTNSHKTLTAANSLHNEIHFKGQIR